MPCTLPETNIFAPENGWLEYLFPFGMAYFRGQTVSLPECIPRNFVSFFFKSSYWNSGGVKLVHCPLWRDTHRANEESCLSVRYVEICWVHLNLPCRPLPILPILKISIFFVQKMEKHTANLERPGCTRRRHHRPSRLLFNDDIHQLWQCSCSVVLVGLPGISTHLQRRSGAIFFMAI